MSRDDLDDAKHQRLLAIAEVCIETSKSCCQEIEAVLDAARLYKDNLRRYRPNLENLYHGLRRIRKRTINLEYAFNSNLDTGASSDSRVVQNLTTEINADLVRWQALKNCSSVVFFGQTFSGRSNEDRMKTAKKILAERDGVSLNDVDDDSQYPTTKGKRGPNRHMCKVNGESCAREVLSLIRDLATQDSAQVDVVSGGKEWLDVRNLLEHRLLEHMTEAGWDWGQYQVGDVVPKEDYEDIPLVRRYKWMCEAAKMNRVDYEIPTLRLCLPSIGREQAEIAILLEQIQRMDPDVTVIVEDKTSWLFKQNQKLPENWVDRLIKSVDFDLTQSVVIETTLINSLISEISHANLVAEPWYSHQVRAQTAEEHAGLKATEAIYPLLQGRRLLVTRSTVEKLREVLEHIGTSRERARARILIPDLAKRINVEEGRVEGADAKTVPTQEETRQAFSALSVHEVPSDLHIPFEIIEDSDVSQSSSTANHLLPLLESAHNLTTARAVLAAWTHDLTMVTGNAILRKQVHRWVDELGAHAKGPRIVVSKTCRIMLSAEVGPTKMFYKEDGTVDSQKLREWRMSRESKEFRHEL